MSVSGLKVFLLIVLNLRYLIMYTVQGRIVATSRFTMPKTNEEMQTVSLYVNIHNFGQVKPAILEIMVPATIEGLEKQLEKEAIFPCNPYSKNGEVRVSFVDDNRYILVKNDKGEFVRLGASKLGKVADLPLTGSNKG